MNEVEFQKYYANKTRYRGNLDPSLILQSELETKLYWVRLENPPETVAHGQPRFKISCYVPGSWNGLKKTEIQGGEGYWWRTLGHFVSMQVLHDPSLVKDLKTLEVV